MRLARCLRPFSVVPRWPRSLFYTWDNTAGILSKLYRHTLWFEFCYHRPGSESTANHFSDYPSRRPFSLQSWPCDKRLAPNTLEIILPICSIDSQENGTNIRPPHFWPSITPSYCLLRFLIWKTIHEVTEKTTKSSANNGGHTSALLSIVLPRVFIKTNITQPTKPGINSQI